MPSSNGPPLDKRGDNDIAQATTMELTTSKSWPCHMCSYENPTSENSNQCQICFTSRLLTPPATADSTKDSRDWPCPKCTFANENNASHCAICNEAKPKIANAKADEFWQCPKCTFSNKLNAPYCQVCGHRNGRNQVDSAAKISKNRPSTAAAEPHEPPMLLPVRQESEFMEALRAIDEHEANEQYHRIVMFCQQNNQLFVDDAFSPSALSIQRLQDNQRRQLPQIHWRRPARITNLLERVFGMVMPWTVCNIPVPSDIVQGILGNCWFLSALAVVAERMDILERILVTRQVSPQGVYQIRLCIDGQWRVVVVDDLFPCAMNGVMIYSKAKRNQLWVPLIEKALAKVYGSYEALSAGRTIEGLAVLTGAPCEAMLLPGHGRSDNQETDPDVVWAQLLSMKDAKFLMGASCGGDREERQEEFHLVGLEPLHAYSLLDVQEVNGERLVKCRNPWGHFSWNGDWSEHSSRWTQELLIKLMPEGFRGGIFWMPYDDFCRYFDSVDVCRYRNNWRELRLAGLLPPHCKRNFVYVAEIAVPDTTEVDVALYQPNVRNEKPTKHGVMDLSVMIFSVDEFGRPAMLVARSDHNVRAFVTLTTVLQPGQYIMIWTAFNHWGMQLTDAEIPKCVVAVHSARALTAQVRSVNPIILADCFIRMILREGRTTGGDVPGVVVYYLSKRWTGVAIMVANYTNDAMLEVQCDCSDSQNAVSTRGALVTSDVVPPLHRQVIMVLTQVEGTASSSFCYHVKYKLTPTVRQDRVYRDVMNYANRFLSFLSGQQQTVEEPPQQQTNFHVPELDTDIYGLHAPRPV